MSNIAQVMANVAELAACPKNIPYVNRQRRLNIYYRMQCAVEGLALMSRYELRQYNESVYTGATEELPFGFCGLLQLIVGEYIQLKSLPELWNLRPKREERSLHGFWLPMGDWKLRRVMLEQAIINLLKEGNI